MVAVKIYAEGGGEGELWDTQFRRAWAAFFRAAGLQGRMPRVVRGQGRKRTYDQFRTAVGQRTPEAAVRPDHAVWQHLRQRDGWEQPENAGDDDAFLMVQVMETWFLRLSSIPNRSRSDARMHVGC